MSDPVEIRRAVAADAARLTEIARAAKAFWGYPEEWLALWRGDLTFTPAYIGEAHVFAAVSGDRIVGVYALVGESDRMEIDHLWVDPDAMGRGIGRVLVAHAAEQARMAGAAVIEIASDPNAVGFYERMGARAVGEVPSVPAGRMLPLLELAV